jgi:ATP-binding cassette, subfamily C, bacterial
MSSSTSRLGARSSPVWDALRPSGTVRTALVVSSGLINILTLTGSLFMMQVYDRVLGSQSFETLIGLSLIALFAYVVQGILDGYRGRLLVLMGEKFDAEIAPKVNAANMTLTLRTANGAQEAQRNSRHVDAIRAFVSGPGPVAICDLPWLPIYLIVAFIMHWSLALTIVLAALFFMWLTYMTDKRSKEPARAALEMAVKRAQESDSALRNVEAAHAMGMRATLASRWQTMNDTYLLAQRRTAFASSGFGITAKTSRMILQSLMLGLGAVLAIKGQISAGAIIAASIMSTRALAPIDQAIGAWKPYIAARDAYKALDDLLRRMGKEPEHFQLPAPAATLTVADITVTVPPALPPAGQMQATPTVADRIALQGVRLEVKAGDAVCVIGPSASGKSTLGRALVGVWRPRAGSIRFDGAPIEQWSSDTLGQHIGYMPQDVQLFDGTIAENIARFSTDATDAKVLAAAQAAGFDEHVRVIGGYDRRIGPGGAHLSSGQRQRLGLARALYNDPFLVVLDEPNSNLDAAGEAALLSALKGVKARGGIVVVIAHNLKVLEIASHVLALEQGQMLAFGGRDKVLAHLKLDPLNPKKETPANASAEVLPPQRAPQPPRQMQGPRVVMQRGGTGGA